MYTGKQPRALPKQITWAIATQQSDPGVFVKGPLKSSAWCWMITGTVQELQGTEQDIWTSLHESMLQLHPKYHPPTSTMKRIWKRCWEVQQKCLEQLPYNDLGLGGNLLEWKEGSTVCRRDRDILLQAGPASLFAWGVGTMPGQCSHHLVLPVLQHLLLTRVGPARMVPCLTPCSFPTFLCYNKGFSFPHSLASQGITRL